MGGSVTQTSKFSAENFATMKSTFVVVVAVDTPDMYKLYFSTPPYFLIWTGEFNDINNAALLSLFNRFDGDFENNTNHNYKPSSETLGWPQPILDLGPGPQAFLKN